MTDTADRLARVTLSVLTEPGDTDINRAVHALGAEEMFNGQFTLDILAEAYPGFDERLAACDPARVLEEADARGIRFIIPSDPEWPAQLNALDTDFTLNDRGGVPVGLWVRGNLRGPAGLGWLTSHAVSIVGSRSATTYGSQVAMDFATGLAQREHTIISGGAFGIDQAAHRGALAAGQPTVAVLACGADRAYPTAHRTLIDTIAQEGAVVSEAPPGAAPTRSRFLARNRLIAALGQGTVVVEAAVRSGALNTAHWTAALCRPLMGVPGPVTSAASAGVHQLLRAGDAHLVTEPAHVLEHLAQPIHTGGVA